MVGHTPYGYAVLRNIWEYEYRCSDVVRRERKQNFTQGSSNYNHQG
jgi:hypothetical protein